MIHFIQLNNTSLSILNGLYNGSLQNWLLGDFNWNLNLGDNLDYESFYFRQPNNYGGIQDCVEMREEFEFK